MSLRKAGVCGLSAGVIGGVSSEVFGRGYVVYLDAVLDDAQKWGVNSRKMGRFWGKFAENRAGLSGVIGGVGGSA